MIFLFLEQQREALEGANTNTAVLQTMGEAAKALKRAHADMDVDKVHDMMDDIAEQQDVAKEISEAISNPVAFGQEFDDDELEAELDELEVITFLCFGDFTFEFSSEFSYFANPIVF